MKRNYPLWTELPYAGEKRPPSNPVEPLAGSWPMHYIRHSPEGIWTNSSGQKISLQVKNPNCIDWKRELRIVQNTLKNLTARQIKIGKFWSSGVPTKQWEPIIDRLVDTYSLAPPRAARIYGSVNAAINDAMVVCWYLKYRWLVPRPNQLDRNLATIVCTPRFPSYVSGHATLAGCASTVLKHYFPAQAARLDDLAEECALARLYVGVHFLADNNEGLRLGRQIGKIVTDTLKNESYLGFDPIDKPLPAVRKVQIAPPPYKQAIPFNFSEACTSKVRTANR